MRPNWTNERRYALAEPFQDHKTSIGTPQEEETPRTVHLLSITYEIPSIVQRFLSSAPSPLLLAYADVPGFRKSATLEEIGRHSHMLTSVRHGGAPSREDDGETFAEKMARLSTQWREQQADA